MLNPTLNRGPVTYRARIATIAAASMLTASLAGFSASAQTFGSVSGSVVDATSQRPLQGAQVYIPGSNIGTLSNQAGRFTLGNVPAGTHVIEYTRPQRLAKYTPSFFLTDSGINLQAKGRFVTADRQKHILIKMQQPDLDIRFIFYDARQRISAKSDTTYADWCVRYGFTYTCRNANLKAGLPIVPIPMT